MQTISFGDYKTVDKTQGIALIFRFQEGQPKNSFIAISVIYTEISLYDPIESQID